jgi:hypothetical protein
MPGSEKEMKNDKKGGVGENGVMKGTRKMRILIPFFCPLLSLSAKTRTRMNVRVLRVDG